MQPDLLALLQACKEAPDDPTPRLILADWLEEHGLADRADCVRLSCRCEELPEYDSRRMAARAMLNDPRRETGRWLQPLRALLPHVDFHKGLLRVTTTAEELLDQRLEDVPVSFLPWLETLRLSNVDDGAWLPALAQRGWLRLFTSLELPSLRRAENALAELLAPYSGAPGALEHLHGLSHQLGPDAVRALVDAADRLPALRHLDVHGSSAIGNEDVQALANSPLLGRLTFLDLHFTPVGAAGAAALARSSSSNRLLSLDLRFANLGAAGLAALLEGPGLTALRRLRLSPTVLSEGSGEFLRRWPAGRSLEHLELMTNDLGNPAARTLAASPILASLQTLNLRCWQINSAGLRPLLAALPPGQLRSLDLANCPLGDAEVGVLANSPALADLRELYLDNTGLGPDGVGRLARSPHLRRLEFLNLSDNQLGAKGIQALTGARQSRGKQGASRAWAPAAQPILPGLRALGLSHTNPTRAGLEALVCSRLLAQLEYVDLSRNRLGVAGGEVIASAATLEAVRYLDLGTCSLGDEGVRALAGSRNLGQLKGIDLGSNRITDAGVRSLAESANMKELAGLTLYGNQITDAGGETLLAWRPDAWAFLHASTNRMSQEMMQRLHQAAAAR